MNQGSDNRASSPVVEEEHAADLIERFGLKYVRVQTGVHGVGPGNNRRARRERAFKPRMNHKGY